MPALPSLSFLPSFEFVRSHCGVRTNVRVRKCGGDGGGDDDFAVSRFRLLRLRRFFVLSLFFFLPLCQEGCVSYSFWDRYTYSLQHNYNCWVKNDRNFIIGGSLSRVGCLRDHPRTRLGRSSVFSRRRMGMSRSPSLPLPLPPSLIPAAFGGVGPRKITLYDRRSDSLNHSKYADAFLADDGARDR